MPGSPAGPQAAPLAAPIVFGPFTLDLAQGTLRRGAAEIVLRPKAWGVLCYLAARPGRVVPGGELLDAIWPGLSVTPQTLTNVVRELRLALDDSARTPRFLRTVHGRGLVFVAAGGERLAGDDDGAFLVGRDDELGRLAQMWSRALNGRSQVAFVSGEPGIGKTTVAGALARRVTAGTRVAYARGAAVEQRGVPEPYLPLLGAFEMLAAVPAAAEAVRVCAPTWLVQMPWLLGEQERARLEALLAGTAPARMLREAIACLRRTAESTPLLLVLEDLHWSDPATLDVIGALARQPLPVPLAVVATLRRVDAVFGHHPVVELVRDLVRAGAATEIGLGPLEVPAIRTYLRARLGNVGWDGLAPRLEAQSAGNPLFLRSLVDQLAELGSPERADLEIGLPDTLRDFVAAAVAAAPDVTGAIVEAASVIGMEFDPAEAAHAADLPVPAVEAACVEAARLGRLLRPAGSGFAFVHDAYRRIVYDDIAPLRRRMLHGRVAAHLERRSGDVPATRMAEHFARAGQPDRAIDHLERAAADAERRFAYAASAHAVRTALDYLESGATAPDDGRAGALYVRLGGYLAMVAGYSAAEVGNAFARARELLAGAEAWPGLFMAEMGLVRFRLSRAENRAGAAHADRLLELARRRIPALAPVASCWAAFAASSLGKLDEARRLLDDGLCAPDAPGLLGHLDVRRILGSQLALVLTVLGELPLAERHAAAALERSRRGGPSADRAHALLLETERAIFLRDRTAGRTAGTEALALAHELGVPSFVALARFYCAWLRDDRDRQGALDDMRAALTERQALGDRWHESMLLALLAETAIASGDPAAALVAVEQARAHIAETDERHYEAEVERIAGACAQAMPARQGRTHATDCLRRALALAESSGARLWMLRAATDLARLGGDDACGRLASILGDFPPGAVGPDLSAAHDLCRAAAGSARHRSG